MDTTLDTLWTHFDWQASLAVLAGVVVINKLLTWLVFQHPQVQRMHEINRESDREKAALEKYQQVIKSGKLVGLFCNLALFVLILPFSTGFQAEPVWHVLLDCVMIFMVYDFFYYFAHRFWFHGNGPMRKVHALHHQARNPTFIDASYVHPLETFVGLALFIGTVALLAALTGQFQVATIIITYLIYVRLNQLNHVYLDLPFFPFRALNWAAAKHHVHHENMHKGNYATITLLYDRLFGTLD